MNTFNIKLYFDKPNPEITLLILGLFLSGLRNLHFLTFKLQPLSATKNDYFKHFSPNI